MDKKSLLQAVKAVGGKVFVDNKDYTVYMIPENQEVWFYEMRNKIGFNNLFHGKYGSSENLSFVVYWDQPEFSEDDNNIEYFLQTANTELLVNLLINDPAK
ncbi:hypothetical protein M0R19_09345, partial [Candidatus Pacearchaeota archaeon]|nr:hypothetical protein [Candidatus Pacearchaeota archaeon]